MNERWFYRVSEIGELLGCSKTKAYQLVASGAIASTRIGSLLRVPREALEIFVKSTVEQAKSGEVMRGGR